MEQDEITDNWLRHIEQAARGRSYYRLQNAVTQEFEFKGKQLGHPSNYAYVCFRCEPADTLSFHSRAEWPESLPASAQPGLIGAIACGIADGLIGGEPSMPHRGCALTLTEIKWDDVMSSEAAFRRASTSAMKELIGEAEWELVVQKESVG